MKKTIKQLFEYVINKELNTNDIELNQYREYLRMQSNYGKGFIPIYTDNLYFYYEVKSRLTGKIYQKNQGYRMFKYSLTIKEGV